MRNKSNNQKRKKKPAAGLSKSGGAVSEESRPWGRQGWRERMDNALVVESGLGLGGWDG